MGPGRNWGIFGDFGAKAMAEGISGKVPIKGQRAKGDQARRVAPACFWGCHRLATGVGS
jgi:hypothetical protein